MPSAAALRDQVQRRSIAIHLSKERTAWKSAFALTSKSTSATAGGIQGQGFRLDIVGHDITDEALADYIVRDMRLLMVGEVRILNKRIIEEAHKRLPAADPEAMN